MLPDTAQSFRGTLYIHVRIRFLNWKKKKKEFHRKFLSVVIVLQNVIELSVLISTRGRYNQSFRYTQTGYPQEF